MKDESHNHSLPSFDDIQRASIANLVAKVSAGQALSSKEEERYRAYLDSQESRAEEVPTAEALALPPIEDTKAWAKYWDVNVRTIQRWKNQGYPYANPAAMAHVIRSLSKCASGAKIKATEILSQSVQSQTLLTDSVATEATKEASLEGFEVADPYQLRDYYGKLIKKAISINDHAQTAHYQKCFLEADEAIRRIELHEQKMGRQEGEMISREDFEKWIWAIVFWLMRGIDTDIKLLSHKLLKLDFKEEVDLILDRFFIARRIVEPLARASKTTGEVSLPKWIITAIMDTVDDFVENGDLRFEKLLKGDAQIDA